MSPETVIATFRVKKSEEQAFRALLAKHWPLLARLELVTPTPPVQYRGADDGGAPVFYEIFTWTGRAAVDAAHTNPEVHALWDAMERCVEDRGGHRKWEFPHVEPVRV
jgi:quinol monooxygenase YgiN